MVQIVKRKVGGIAHAKDRPGTAPLVVCPCVSVHGRRPQGEGCAPESQPALLPPCALRSVQVSGADDEARGRFSQAGKAYVRTVDRVKKAALKT